MNKYFNKFLALNEKIIDDYKNKKEHVLLVDRGRYKPAICLSIASAAINKKYKLNTIVLSENDHGSEIINLYKSFGIKKFYLGFKYKFFIKKFFIFIHTFALTLKALIDISRNL